MTEALARRILRGGAGNFAAQVELFYSGLYRQTVENKEVRNGREVATLEPVGEASRGSL
jgi:hypothetical protein